MSRINTNVNSLIAQRIVNQQNQSLTKTLERLSTGFAINRGADNPAGLIVSERLRSEMTSVESAIASAERADQVANIAEGGLQEINSLLVEIQGLVSAAANDAGLSVEEKEANQQQIDAIIQTIDRIASTTSFNGTKLLNGSYDFQVSGVDGNVSDYKINAAKLADGQTLAVNAVITGSAQHAGLFLNLNAAVVNTGADDADSRFTIELAGAKGTREFSFASGTAIASVTAAINQFTSVTGVSAVTSGNYVELKSTSYGSDQFVSVQVKNAPAGLVGALDTMNATNENLAVAGTNFTALTAAVRDEGQDVAGIINGVTARGKGLTLSVSTDVLDAQFTLDTAAGGATTRGSISPLLNITDGGAKFNLGAEVNLSNQVRLGLSNVAARNLGSAAAGYISQLGSGGDYNIINGSEGLQASQELVNEAINQITSMRGRIGSFQTNVVGSSIRSLNVAYENLAAAESAIRDTDYAKETAALTRNQILVQAANAALQLSNSMPQNVLQLL